MKSLTKKQIGILILALLIVGAGVFFIVTSSKQAPEPTPTDNGQQVEEDPFDRQTIGQSVEGRDIESFTFNEGGDSHLLFVGGVHGGYEWNSVLLAYKFIDYLEENPDETPESITVSVIPSANPDGVYDVVGKEGRFSGLDVPSGDKSQARFNANGVDLNRNFDCNWEPTSTWRGQTVSAGDEPFSEPEAQAIRDFVNNNDPTAVVFWHSQANAVYASECNEGVIPETIDIMSAYAQAGDYRAVESFDAYPITGDAEGWLASIGIPALTVELETHETIEWERNLNGVKALFEYYK